MTALPVSAKVPIFSFVKLQKCSPQASPIPPKNGIAVASKNFHGGTALQIESTESLPNFEGFGSFSPSRKLQNKHKRLQPLRVLSIYMISIHHSVSNLLKVGVH